MRHLKIGPGPYHAMSFRAGPEQGLVWTPFRHRCGYLMHVLCQQFARVKPIIDCSFLLVAYRLAPRNLDIVQPPDWRSFRERRAAVCPQWAVAPNSRRSASMLFVKRFHLFLSILRRHRRSYYCQFKPVRQNDAASANALVLISHRYFRVKKLGGGVNTDILRGGHGGYIPPPPSRTFIPPKSEILCWLGWYEPIFFT